MACTSMPMRRTRSLALGGLPSGSPSVAEVTPTLAAWAAAGPASAKAPIEAMTAKDKPGSVDLVMSVFL